MEQTKKRRTFSKGGQILSKLSAQSPSYSDADACNGCGILNAKASATAIAGGEKARNNVQLLIVDLLVVVCPQTVHCDHGAHCAAFSAVRDHGIVRRGIQGNQ